MSKAKSVGLCELVGVGEVYVTPDNLMKTTKTRAMPVLEFFSRLDKGQQRKIRKELHKVGRTDLIHASLEKRDACAST